MRNSNSQSTVEPRSRRRASSSNPIIILPVANRQQNANSNRSQIPLPSPPPRSRLPENILGPVSYSQMKYLNLLKRLKKSHEEKNDATEGQKVKMKTVDENANGRHVFLMDNSIKLQEYTQEITESERADRALFTQSIMLSMLQLENKNFQP